VCRRRDRHERSTVCVYRAITEAQLEHTAWRGGGRVADYEPAMTVAQIARALGVTERCVEQNLASALRKIGPLLDAWRDHEPARAPIPSMFAPLGRRVRG